MAVQWLTTAPNPNVYRATDGGVRGWRCHAVDADAAETFDAIRTRRAACGLVPAHGWGMDLFIEQQCERCARAVSRPLQAPNA